MTPHTATALDRRHREIDTSRVLLGQSLEVYKTGDRDGAYALSKKAYLDHFEFVEIPLRLRDPNLVLDTEFKYAALRNEIRDGAPVSKIRSDTATVRAALVDVDRALSRKGVAAPAVAFGFSFSILFREGVEAVLLIAILLGSLAAGRVASAMAAGTTLAFVGLGFTAVFREGFETVLFYQALALFAEGLILWVVLGAVAAAVALGGVGYAILGLGRQLPLKPMLVGGAGVLLLLSVAFVGNAVRSLQSADLLAATPVSWPRLPVFLAELTGIHPTSQGLVVQAVLLGVYVLGALYVFAWQPARRRRRQVAETAT